MRKGFTLIELLAVIVILAIIAVIATPIVLGIINDTKKSATIRSAEFYLDAAISAILKENLKVDGELNPSTCTVKADGNVTCDEIDLQVNVEGQRPTSGEIMLEQGNIIDATLVYADGTVSMNTDKQLVFME